MILQLIAIATGLAVGWIKKGSLWAITNLKLRWLWILPVSYVVQIVSINYLHGNIYKWMLVISYILLLAFCLRNVSVPGVWWTFAGTASNFLVMSFNNLRMPAYMPPIYQLSERMAVLLNNGDYGKSIAMGQNTHLNFLGDIFFLKLQPPTLVSIGDILFAIGIVVLLQHAMQVRKEVL